MKRLYTTFATLLLIAISSGNVLAQVVSFSGLSEDALNPTIVQQGTQISYDLIGSGFPATNAGDFTLTFGSAGVLAFNSFIANNPPWDTSDVLLPPNPAAIGDATMLVDTSGASQVGDFIIGTIIFDVIGSAGSSTSISLSDAFSGWTGPNNDLSNPILVEYIDGHVQVVPVPAALWLMLSALSGISILGKTRKLQTI